MPLQQYTTSDGRIIEYLISGAENGFPLIFIHGTPGAYIPAYGLPEACESKAIKLITFSRAGYGGSSRRKGRKIVEEVDDIEALKRHLGIERCFVGGWSGGGPISLACAAKLPGCIATLCVAGVAPHDAEGLDWMAGQGEDNIQEMNAASAGEEKLTEFCLAQRTDILQSGAVGITEALSSILPDVDKQALLEHPNLSQSIVDSFHIGLRTNVEGWVDDDLAMLQPWGFTLDEVKTPVFLYQGSDDKMVPFAHGQWIAANLPKGNGKTYLLQGQGHISIFLGKVESMLDELLAEKS